MSETPEAPERKVSLESARTESGLRSAVLPAIIALAVTVIGIAWAQDRQVAPLQLSSPLAVERR